MLSTDFIAGSYKGLTHTENQDGYLILDEADYTIFAIFDGVSRAKNPRKGVDIAMKFITQHHHRFIGFKAMQLNELMEAVNQNIFLSGIPECLTTYVIAGFYKNNPFGIIYSNLGDSRIYHINGMELHQLTTDDTLWPGSNILTKCLGSEYVSHEDFRQQEHTISEGYMLLATDGCYALWDTHHTELVKNLNKSGIKQFKGYFDNFITGKNYDDATYVLVAYNSD